MTTACVDCGSKLPLPRRIVGRDRCHRCQERFEAAQAAERERLAAERAERIEAYEEVLDQLRPGTRIGVILSRIAAAKELSGLGPEDLDGLHNACLARFFEQVLADDVITADEDRALANIAAGLARAVPPEWANRYHLARCNAGLLPRDPAPEIFLEAEEIAYWRAGVALLKETTVSEYRTNFHSVSFPIGDSGVRYRAGSSRGRTVVVGTRIEVADRGWLTVTSDRIVFAGSRQTMEFPLHRIVGVNVFGDGIGLQVANRQSVPTFRTGGEVNEVTAAIIATATALSRGTFVPAVHAQPPAPTVDPPLPALLKEAGYSDPRVAAPPALPSRPKPPAEADEAPISPAHVHPAMEGTFAEDDPASDQEAETILADLRTFSNEASVDGPSGVATGWRARAISLEKLRGVRARWWHVRVIVSNMSPEAIAQARRTRDWATEPKLVLLKELEKFPVMRDYIGQVSTAVQFGGGDVAALRDLVARCCEAAAEHSLPPSLTPYPEEQAPPLPWLPLRDVSAEAEGAIQALGGRLLPHQLHGLRDDFSRGWIDTEGLRRLGGELDALTDDASEMAGSGSQESEPEDGPAASTGGVDATTRPGGAPPSASTAGDGNPANAVYSRTGEWSWTRELLVVLALADRPLTPEEISPMMSRQDDGTLYPKASIRACIRNVQRVEKNLQSEGVIDRGVLIVDWSGYDVDGANRYSLAANDKTAIRSLAEADEARQ